MENNPLISVIIPVYNVEQYLTSCVNSVLNQTYDNLEIILVDDGSPDACPAICDSFETKDKRFSAALYAVGCPGFTRADINNQHQ